MEDIDWVPLTFEQDTKNFTEAVDTMKRTLKPFTLEIRLRKMWKSADGASGPSWCLTSIYPELHDDGTIRSVMGTSMDISHLKWAEKNQNMRIEEAMEAKRQQENL